MFIQKTKHIFFTTQTFKFSNKNRAQNVAIFYLLECIPATGSQAFLLGLYLSALAMHMVPSLPPTQYKLPSSAATPQLLRRLLIEGRGDQRPTLGSNLSTLDW